MTRGFQHQRGARAAVGLLALLLIAGLAWGQGGGALIGNLEGPEVVTDEAQWPKAFNEAPQLAELVKQGKLPPVAERIGQDPLVIKPVHEVGKYGGLWRRGFSGPADFWNGIRCCTGPDGMLYWEKTGNDPTPNIAKSYEVQDEGRTTILHLRRGMKWSDGHPFTADDFVFWFKHILNNEEHTPTFPSYYTINGKRGALEKIDDHTVALEIPGPLLSIARRIGRRHATRRPGVPGSVRRRPLRPGALFEAVSPGFHRQRSGRQNGQGSGL